MKKSEIEYHRSGHELLPAVNVKIYKHWTDVPLPIELGQFGPVGGKLTPVYTDPGFDHDWIKAHWDDASFEDAIADGWEQLQDEAENIWPDRKVKVTAEGRSGGWAVVHGLNDPADWNAIELNKWARFAKFAREVADDVPLVALDLLYTNVYLNELVYWNASLQEDEE